jgi:uncharacterized protein (TIGR00255 family)
MTGFGKGEARGKAGMVKADVRTVNHKFLEIGIKLPEGLLGLEDRIRELAQQHVRRGKVNINIAYEDGLEAADKICVDQRLAKVYYKQLSGLKKKMRLDGSIRLDQLISLPGVITYEPKKAHAADVWGPIQAALGQAFRALDRARLKEGMALYADLKKRVRIIEKAIEVIKGRTKINTDLYREKLKKSINELSKGIVRDFDKGRLEQEVALYAKNSDISEEITRLCAHMRNLSDTVEKDDEAGKKLDFIAQELNREANTVGSKVSDFKISKKVIQIKGEIEKLREQAKNIE